MKYRISDQDGIFCITDKNKKENIFIKDKVFQEELSDYRIEDRKEFIDKLIDWISECKNSDREIMKNDLKLIMSEKGDYILSSISTNEYIFENDEQFDTICEEIIQTSKNLK